MSREIQYFFLYQFCSSVSSSLNGKKYRIFEPVENGKITAIFNQIFLSLFWLCIIQKKQYKNGFNFDSIQILDSSRIHDRIKNQI